MSVIQALREKYATTVVIVVCISLVAFLLMDAFVGPKSFFKKDTEVVTVNDEGYSYKQYMRDVKQAENNYRRQNPNGNLNDQIRNRLKNQVYQRFVQKQILQGQYDKLGIAFSTDELRSLTITADADPRIKQIPGFQNPQTGEFDPNRVITFINNLKNAPGNNRQALQQRMQWEQMENMLKNASLLTKYTSLINNGIFVPSWLVKEKMNENNKFSNISFVSEPYTSINDSSVNVTDQDLQNYLNEHKKQFHIDANRTIEYVSFNVIPSAKDSATILGRLEKLKSGLDTTSNSTIDGFITRNSETPFIDRYLPGSMIQSSVKNQLLSLPQGSVYGPYYEGNYVAYAKMLGSKTVADTAQIQQVLVSNRMFSDSIAQFKVDSLRAAVNSGADFSQVINTYTNGRAQNNGNIMITANSTNVPDQFIQFVNSHNVGDLGIVKSQYGYHLIKVRNKSGMEKGYKIAYLTAAMDASQTTDNGFYSQANKFRGLNGTREAFEKAAKEKGYNIQEGANLTSSTYEVNDLSSSREIVHWAFNAEKNDVSKVFVLPDSYVVAVLKDITPEGTAPLESVKSQIQAVVRREKKAEVISKKYQGKNLQQIASAMGDSVSTGNKISFATSFIPNSGFEPKVVGASFNKNWEGKLSKPIFGNNGVYYLTVNSIYDGDQADSTSSQNIKNQMNTLLQREVGSQLRDVLVEQSEVDDNRMSFPGL